MCLSLCQAIDLMGILNLARRFSGCEVTFVIIRSRILNPTLGRCVKINSKRAGCHQ